MLLTVIIINYVSLLVTLTALAFVLLPTHRQDQITTLLIIGLIMILLALFYATVMDSRCVAETGPDMDLLRGATSDFNEWWAINMPSDESTLVVFDRLGYQAVCKSVFNKLSVSVPTTAQHTINLGYFQAFDITLMPANLTELEYLQVQEAAFDRLVQMSNETGDLDLTNIELELAVDRLVDDMIDELDQIVEILRPEEPDHSYRQRLINEIHRQERISHILITLYITLFIYTSTPLFK